MLKALLLRSKISTAQKQLEELRKKDPDFKKREDEIAADIKELSEKPDATEEEKKAVEDATDDFDKDRKAHDEKKKGLEENIDTLSKELKECEESQPVPPAPKKENQTEEGRKKAMMIQHRNFKTMTMEERSAFVKQDTVHEFCKNVRSLCKTRSVSGGDIIIPTEVMPLLTDSTERYSKLMKHVNMKPVSGKARVRVQGVVPEAVWTEQGGKINELSIGFTGTDVDGYSVAGAFTLQNWILEDNDVGLLSSVVDSLGQSIGLAVDKAILYGTGNKMPLGIITRLLQTAAPASGHTDAVTWKDLHASNVLKIAATKTGVDVFKELLKDTGAAKSNYSNGEKFWVMNDTTLNALKAEALSINANGAIVSGMDNTMPIIGGAVETLTFIPDNVVVGGYGSLYLLAQRAGTRIDTSKDIHFYEDETAVKGVARYDGQPLIPQGFVAIGLSGATISASDVTFAADPANAVASTPAG